MTVKISDNFTYKKLITYVLPCVAMMVMTSIYSIVDGFFVSNLIGKNAFAAVNLIMPVLMGIAAFGFMIGTGGSALVSYYLGLKDSKKANEVFSMLIWLAIIGSAIIAIIGFVFMPEIVDLLGKSAGADTRKSAVTYGRILILSETFYILQNSFQSFLTTAGKQTIGLALSITSGITNMVLDYVFMKIFGWGIAGAAIATMMGQIIGGVIPFVYFIMGKNDTLRLRAARFDWRCIGKACANGSSEMMTNLAASIVAVVYNIQLLRFAAENGVAAYGVIMYVAFIFTAVFFGYAIGINPLVGYNYGAGNKAELKNLLHKSLVLTAICALAMLTASELLALPIARIFVGYDSELCAMTQKGMMLYSTSFLFCGFNIFGSGFFTGLGNGPVSAAISFLRTLVIELISVLVLPAVFGLSGIWCAVTVAEVLTLVITSAFLINGRKKYGY